MTKPGRNDRKVAARVAAVLAGRNVPMTREQIHERAEARRRHICDAIHARHPFPSLVARPRLSLPLPALYEALGTYYRVAASTIYTIHRQHCYREPALDTGCICEPDKRSDICVHHGDRNAK